MNDRYVTLDIPGTELMADVKLDDEGVVIDIRDTANGEVIASTWKLYSEMGVEIKPIEQ